MRDILGESLKKLRWTRRNKKRISTVLMLLSLAVVLDVFWILRQPGLTLAGDATCGLVEHIHSDECWIQTCICNLPEKAHVHENGCYETQMTEGYEEAILICDLTGEPHIHNDECYEITEADGIEKTLLICNLVSEPHEHTDSCFEVKTEESSEEKILICILSEDVHAHGDACYIQELTCSYEEHVHSIACYSDETADVETLLDWQNMFADYPYTGDLRQDLVGIAKTQVGYCESTRNFEIGTDGIRHGYTRYGAWYGTPYRDWSAAFVSFCLNYADADPEQTPGNIGANAMAENWKNLGRFAPAAEYVPVIGDLVFFTDNTVGIVTEIQNATFYVIRGDIEDSVQTDAIPLGDASIAGWGITGEISSETPEEPTEVSEPEATVATLPDTPENTTPIGPATELTQKDLLDISHGPVFFLFTDGNAPPQIQTYSFKASRSITDLSSYLVDVGGSLSFMLLTSDDTVILPDENNNYTVDPNIGYKLHMRITSLKGLHPGTYQYQLPQGITVTAGEGTFSLTDPSTGLPVDVGSWNVTADGLITLTFNENMKNQSGVSIPATMGIQFNVQDDSIIFDGNITVTVNPPPTQEDPTELQKWGSQGYEGNKEGKTDNSKIYWTVKVSGHNDSLIPGNVLTDNIVNGEWYGIHRYTQSDIDAGLRIDASGPDGKWHSFTIHQGDPNLQWTESGWSYTIPETVICQDGEELTLGSDGWEYLVNYTTTPDPSSIAGYLTYTNNVTIEDQAFDGYVRFQHGSVNGEINKTGSFQADAGGGSFRWEISADIPGRQPNKKADFWYLVDNMNLYDASGNLLGVVTNDADKATVTATHNGTTVQVPHINQATPADTFAWYVSWSSNTNGVDSGRTITLLHRCDCTAETCVWWDYNNNVCGSFPWVTDTVQDKHFCQCWTVEGLTTITLTYNTTDLSIVENYGGVGNQLANYVSLNYVVDGNTGNPFFVDDGWVSVTIPGLFKKELTQDFNGYTAHYSITVNEAKLSLTNGSPLYIHDEMTETLAFISGSLVISSEDANGNTSVLHQDEDYTVTYDGSGTQTDKNGNKVHILDITLLHPQPVKYTLDYDATLIIPNQTTSGVTYSNSATVTLWGKNFTDDSPEKTYTEFGITGESYKVQLSKTSASTGHSLSDATFGLFNAQGGQITMDTTDINGQLFFQTDITQGIIFQAHMLYYMQELEAPPGYQLDDTEHWFVFCNNTADTCEACTAVIGDLTAVRIPHGQIRTVYVTNEIMNYDLPATGGPGIYPLILVSVIFIMTPLVYGSIRRRKQERRGSG